MDPLTPEDVQHIAQLAYIKLSDEESEKMRIQLTNILGQFQALAAVDTEVVEPTGHTTDANTVMRRDERKEAQPITAAASIRRCGRR